MENNHISICIIWANTGKLPVLWSNTSKNVRGPVKNVGGPEKLLYMIMFDILKGWQKYIFSCDQAALRTLLSVRPSVSPSVCLSVTPFSLCSSHRIIMKFSGVITIDKSDVHAKGQGQRSKVKVTEVKTQLSHFRTLIPVWIHIWWWNDAQSLKQHRRGALLFFKVICQISRSHGWKKIIYFDPNWVFVDSNSSLNSTMAMKWCTKLEAA